MKSALTVANPEDDDVSREVYLGVVKSYNDRRGFGFLACTETADRFGRDVYMPKALQSKAAWSLARYTLGPLGCWVLELRSHHHGKKRPCCR